MSELITQEEFQAFTPRQRGYAVYMVGSRADQPNVPDEENPYPRGSKAYAEWMSGLAQAIVHAQDCDE